MNLKLLALFGFFSISFSSVVQATDMSVTKSVVDEFNEPVVEVAPGTQIAYLIVIRDAQDGVDGVDVLMRDFLPAEISLVSVDSDGGVCADSDGRDVSCSFGTFPDGATVNILITGILSEAAVLGTEVLNVALLDAANEIRLDDNSAGAAFVVGAETVGEPDVPDGGCSLNPRLTRSRSWATIRRDLIPIFMDKMLGHGRRP